MAAYRRVTFDRCGRNSRFDCKMKMDGAFHCWVAEVFERRKKITVMCDFNSQPDKSWRIGHVLFAITKSWQICLSALRSLG